MTDTYEYIRTVEDLHFYLTQAMVIEHATLPPYLTALYSLKPGSNLEAFHIIRDVAVEEMLHLTLAANVFNAVGGDITGVLTNPDFVPSYPTVLPTNPPEEYSFEVSVAKFSLDTVNTFLDIERVHEVAPDEPIVQPRPESDAVAQKKNKNNIFSKLMGKFFPEKDEAEEGLHYYSIGLFYAEIIRGLQTLDREYKELGKNLFIGDPRKQITREYYYDGAGDIVKVTDLDSALKAMYVIQTQGEGSGSETIYDAEKELCHYYRFQQLGMKEPQYYVVDKEDPRNSDKPNEPSGAKFNVEFGEVYPVMPDITLSKLRQYCEIGRAHV